MGKLVGVCVSKLELVSAPYTILLCPGVARAKRGLCVAIHVLGSVDELGGALEEFGGGNSALHIWFLSNSTLTFIVDIESGLEVHLPALVIYATCQAVLIGRLVLPTSVNIWHLHRLLVRMHIVHHKRFDRSHKYLICLQRLSAI